MKGSSDEATWIFDAGHLHFGGTDVMDPFDKWGDRLCHVHFKDVRGVVAWIGLRLIQKVSVSFRIL
jgi:inosose dehydratase